MQAKGSLPRSQEPSTAPYPEPDLSNLYQCMKRHQLIKLYITIYYSCTEYAGELLLVDDKLCAEWQVQDDVGRL
jgi:hypothetical protein